MSKADNMLSILWLLKTGKRMTAKQLSETLEIHIRTVYRYIDSLCASGVPIVSDSGHNGGYSLLPHFSENPLFFDLDEQKALVHAAVFAQEAGYPFGDALNRAVTKLKRYTNEEQLENINRHLAGFEVLSPPPDASLEGILQELEISAAEGLTLDMEYHTGKDPAAKKRAVDPYGIVYWQHKWYLVAYCHLRREVRSFRADRIRALARTDSVFERPQEFSARRFLLGSLLPGTGNDDRLLTVRIEGRTHALNDLCGHWYFGHALTERTAEQAVFRFEESAITPIMLYYLLIYGKSLRIVEPAALNGTLAEIAEGLRDYYRNGLAAVERSQASS